MFINRQFTFILITEGKTKALPLLAQGKTMASGACTSGQSLELTLIPYGNGYAWDADSNVREANSDYTVYTDGSITYTADKINLLGRTIENSTGENIKTILIGKTENANIAQAYTTIEIIAGRVDGWLGIGWIFLAQSNLVIGKRQYDMSNIGFIVTQKDNQLYVYCTLDTYSNIICNIPVRSKFTILNQEVSSIEGTQIWGNNWS